MSGATPGPDGLPPGKMRATVTFLEMLAPPRRPPPPAPARPLALLRANKPTVSFYRYLYNTVGEPWLWHERRALDDLGLAAIIQDARVDIFVLYADGVPAGYAELDRRQEPDIELSFFGLMPEFIGQGLGRYLLGCAIAAAWTRNPKRFWLHTCNYDHPRAIAFYQRAGFVPYRQEVRIFDDPYLSGLMPPRRRAT